MASWIAPRGFPIALRTSRTRGTLFNVGRVLPHQSSIKNMYHRRLLKPVQQDVLLTEVISSKMSLRTHISEDFCHQLPASSPCLWYQMTLCPLALCMYFFVYCLISPHPTLLAGLENVSLFLRANTCFVYLCVSNVQNKTGIL